VPDRPVEFVYFPARAEKKAGQYSNFMNAGLTARQMETRRRQSKQNFGLFAVF
jgi:hypothetical protein